MRMVTQLRFIQRFNRLRITLRDEEQFVREPAAFIPMLERQHRLDIPELPTTPMVYVASAICQKDESANQHGRTRQMPARMLRRVGGRYISDWRVCRLVPRCLS